jgi:predicted cobalt transporter CbtA
LYAAFHVLSVTGTGTITFTVKTAATIAMTGATTRITSSAFAAVGAEIDTVAGPITDGFARVDWTIAGFTSVTFAAAIGTYNT